MDKKILIFIAALVLVLTGVIAYLFIPNPKVITGTVTRIGEPYSSTEWGVTYRRLPFLPKHLVTAAFLSPELQQEGLEVTCLYYVRDVIGTSEGDVVIEGGACRRSVPTEFNDLSDGWREYVNHTLGFSINIPEKVYSSYVCPDTEYSDVVVVENTDLVSLGVNCGGNVRLFGNAWTIRVYDFVKDNDTISSIFKKTYGDTCEIDPKFVSDGNGNFDITYLSDGKEPDQTNCWINYASYFKYNPALQKIVTWSIGQESNFWKGDPTWISDTESPGYDQEMSKSFRFIAE